MRVVIVGAGEVGTHLAHVLSQEQVEIVLVDKLGSALAAAEESIDAMMLTGDGTHWSVLRKAEVERADLVVAVTGSDEANVVIAAMAHEGGASRSVARVDAAGFYRTKASVERGVLGIDSLLCASRLVTLELLRLLRARHASYVGFFAANQIACSMLPLRDGMDALGQAGASIKNAGGKLVRAVLRDGVLRRREDITRLDVGDQLLLAGTPAEVAVAQDLLQGSLKRRRAILVGGGDVGSQIARALLDTERRVELIERDVSRCETLAQELPGIHVIHGDGTSIALLRDLQVADADHLLAVTRSDEANLMVSLLGINLGVKSSFALVHRAGYSEVYGHLGISGTAGSHEVIARAVWGLLPNDGVLRQERLPDCSHELVELSLSRRIERNVTVDELTLPPSCMLVGIADHKGFQAPVPGAELAPGGRLLIAQPAHLHRDMAKRVRELGKGAR